MKHIVLASLILAALLSSCRPKPLEGGEEIAQEAERHKVKRITEGQIFEAATRTGNRITQLGDSLHVVRMRAAAEKKVLHDSLCRPELYPEVQAIAKKYGATVIRLSQQPKKATNRPQGTAAQLLDAYAYSAEKGEVMEPNLQRQGQQDFLFTKAIVLSDAACVHCHQLPEPAPQAKEAKRAVPLLGMWSVALSKPAIVRAMTDEIPKRKWGKKPEKPVKKDLP